MSLRVVAILAGAALLLAGPASAGEKVKHKYKHKHKEVERTCVCTMGGPGQAPLAAIPAIPAIPAVPPIPPIPHGAWEMHMAHPGSPNVMVFRDGDDERVVIVRKHGKHGKRFRDSADDNNDGEVSRREFMRRAEKHFKERDRDGDGKLEGDEMAPMPFEMPIPPMPPEPPEAPDPDDE
jgi:hypothetical protein